MTPIDLDAIIEAGELATPRPWCVAKAPETIGMIDVSQFLKDDAYATLAANSADHLAARVKQLEAEQTRLRTYAARLAATDKLVNPREVAAVILKILGGGVRVLVAIGNGERERFERLTDEQFALVVRLASLGVAVISMAKME